MSLRRQARRRVLLLLGSLFLVIVLILGWLGVTQFRVRRHMTQLRADGMAAFGAGDNVKAVDNLGRYRLGYPNDVEALSAYARARLKAELPQGRNLLEAERAFRQLLSLSPDHPEDWRDLMRIEYGFRKWTEANAAADGLLARVPNDGEALAVRAGSLTSLHRYPEALDAANARLAIDPSDVSTQVDRLFVMNQLNSKPKDLTDIGEKLVAAHPNDQGALLVEANAYGICNELDKAQVALRAAARQPCKDRNTGILLIRELDRWGLYPESLQVIEGLAQNGDGLLRQVLLRRLWEQSRIVEAMAMYDGPAKESLQDPESLGIYSDCLRVAGKTSDYTAVIQGLSAKHDDPMAAVWVAIENAESSSSHTGLPEERAACVASEKVLPPDPYLYYYEGKASALLGDTDTAIDLWTKAADMDRTWSLPLIEKAMTLLTLGRRDAAEEAATQAFHRSRSSNRAAIAMATVWFAQVEGGALDTAGKLNDLIDEVQHYLPGEEQTLRMRVSLLARSGQMDKAIEVARSLLNHTPPPSARTLLALANVSRQWKLGIEADCIAAAEKNYGRTPETALAAALDDYLNKKGDAGSQLLRDTAASAKGDDAVGYHLALASYLEATGDASATSTWAALGDQNPDNLTIQRASLTSQAAYRDRQFYDRTINRVEKLFGDDSIGWKVARARWLLDSGNDAKTAQQAADLLADVVRRSPDSLGANVLLGIAKERLGDISGATVQLSAAQHLDPNSPAVAMDLARMEQYRGDFDAARQQLEIAAKSPGNPQQQADTAMMLAAQGDVKQAIKIMEPLVDKNAQRGDPLALASLYCRDRNFDQAQAICDRLLKHPDPPTILLAAELSMFRRDPAGAEKALSLLAGLKKWRPGEMEQTRGDFYYGFGDFDSALGYYQAATVAEPNNALPWLCVIDCQAALGKASDALTTLAEALKHVPDNPHLNDIRMQSELLSKAGNSSTSRLLTSAVVRNPSPDGAPVQTLHAIEQVASSPDPTAGEVLPPLRKLATDQPRFLPAQIALIETELRLGRAQNAVDDAEKLVQAFPSEVRPCELAVDAALSEAGLWDQALQMARTWRSRIIGDAINVDLTLARLQLRTGDVLGAVETVKPVLSAPLLQSAEKWQMLTVQATALVRQGKPDDAANLLWPIVQTTPQIRNDWMNFVASGLPADKAEQWLKRTDELLKSEKGSEQSELDLGTAWDILAQRSNDTRYAQMARDQVHAMEQVPSLAGAASFQDGIFHEEDNDYAGAETAYRRAVQAHQIPAMNNLAMLLAYHGGGLTEAVDLARQCVKENPTEAIYWDTLAELLGQAKQYDQAVDAIRTAVRLEPNKAKWRVNLANALILDGQRDQAKRIVVDLDLMSPGVHSLTKPQQERLDTVRKILANSSTATAAP